MKVSKFSSDGQPQGEYAFEGFPVFEDDKGVPALKSVVLAFQANIRQGNACTKTRGEVSGTGKKPWRQKGTGMARHGSRRSPIWPGGGVVSGPRGMTNFTQKINRRVKALALARAFFERVQDRSVILVEKFQLPAPKTSAMVSFLEKVCPDAKTILLVDTIFVDDIILAARNLAYVYLMDALSLNAWDLLHADRIIITRQSCDAILSRLTKKD